MQAEPDDHDRESLNDSPANFSLLFRPVPTWSAVKSTCPPCRTQRAASASRAGPRSDTWVGSRCGIGSAPPLAFTTAHSGPSNDGACGAVGKRHQETHTNATADKASVGMRAKLEERPQQWRHGRSIDHSPNNLSALSSPLVAHQRSIGLDSFQTDTSGCPGSFERAAPPAYMCGAAVPRPDVHRRRAGAARPACRPACRPRARPPPGPTTALGTASYCGCRLPQPRPRPPPAGSG